MKMYKTVRHGENSLQYTILPQNDDFRMDNKLSSAESSCTNAVAARKPKSKRQRRRSFFAYLGIFFVCTVIVGAIVIPFLVSTECLPSPTEWFLKSKTAFMRYNTKLEKHNKTLVPNNASSSSSSSSSLVYDVSHHANVGKQVQIINENGVEKIILHVNKTVNNQIMNNNITNHIITTQSTNQVVTIDHTDQELPTMNNNNNYNNNRKDLNPVTPTELQHKQQQPQLLQYLPLSTTIVNSPHAPAVQQSQVQQQQPLIGTPTITTRIIQVPLLKSTAKKPIIPPVLVKSKSNQQQHPHFSTITESITTVQVKKNNNEDWLQAHWPFIDSSTYFQWMGYKPEDSVLLPAILGCALVAVILIIAICLLARNKRSLASLVKKRNRHDIEESGAEDNATLLTATNLSDED